MNIFTLSLFILTLGSAQGKMDKISYKLAEKEFLSQGVSSTCSLNSYQKLMAYVGNLQTKYQQIETNPEETKINKDSANDYLKLLEHALLKLSSTQHLSCNDFIKNESYNLGRAIVYAILTETNPASQMNVGDWVSMLGNGVVTVPYRSPKNRIKNLSVSEANKEANNLFHPLTGKMITPFDLIKMNHIQVARLDIGANHPMWRNESDRQKIEWKKGGAWKLLEDTINKAATKKFEKKCKSLCESLEKNYDLNQARKVLIFSKIKTSATSPKADAKDLYGFNWKIKWGVEAFVEPVVSRLYMKLGGKFSDLTYTNPHGAQDLTLILGSRNIKSSCHNINNLEWFNYCFLISSYKFHPVPFTYQSGQITEQNIDAIFSKTNTFVKDPAIRSQYLGRTWVTFRESLVEFSADNLYPKVGTGPENHLGFENDRVLRGLSVLAMWVGNDDAKEDNSSTVLYEDQNQKTFAHYWHDVGSALGSTVTPGNINSIKTDSDFMYIATSLWRNSPKLLLPYEFLGHKWIVFPRLHLYKPNSWNHVTYSDALWMAMKIASLQEDDIIEAVSASQLPDFAQDALVFKLMDRRIRMSKIFGITFPGVQDSYPVTIRYDLTQKSVREAIAKKYDINPARIEWEVEQHKLLKKGEKFYDVAVQKGQISSCSDSLLVNLLEKTWFPSGLERRMSRTNYLTGLPDCKFNP